MQPDIKKLFVNTLFLSIAILVNDDAFAQEGPANPGQQYIWVKEGVGLTLGQKVEYKTVAANRFKKGELIGITDSTLVFLYSGDVSIIGHSDLAEIKLFKEKNDVGVKVLAGIAIMAVGGLVAVLINGLLYSGGSSKSPPPPPHPTPGDYVGGVIIAGGLVYIIVSVAGHPKTQTIKLQPSK